MTNKKETANNERQAKAVKVYTEEQCKNELARLQTLFTNKMDAYLRDTKNGAYKITRSKPENNADVKDTAKVGGKTYYFVPTGEIRISYASYLAYLSALDKLAKAKENFITFEEWKDKKEQKTFIEGAKEFGATDEKIEEVLKGKYEKYREEKLGKDLDESESE